jgi:hypothetical protein
MKDEFVTYEQALSLKELGFDEPCLTCYKTDKKLFKSDDWCCGFESTDLKKDWMCCLAPLKQQAFRWFREKEYYSEITTECTQVDGSVGFSWRIWKPWTIEEWSIDKPGDEWSYETYEEAEQSCLDKLIEIYKNNSTSI